MILFDGAFYNPDLIWKIDRVTDTVTLTIVLTGMGAGTIYTEDHVFGSEALAIVALDALVKEINDIDLNELTLAVTTGVVGNPDLTRSFERSGSSSVGHLNRSQRDFLYATFIKRLADVIKGVVDA